MKTALRISGLLRLHQRQNQGDGDDGQGTGELYGHGFIQGLAAQAPHAVPGGGRRRDGGGVVHRRTGEDAKGLARGSIKADGLTQQGKQQRRQHIEKKDDRDGLGYLLVIRMDHRRRGGDGAATADGRAHANERADIAVDVQQLMHHKGHQQRRGDGADDDRQRLFSGLQHHIQIQPKAQQHHGSLQDLLGGEADARLTDRSRRPQ